MQFTIRDMRDTDARSFLEVHHAAVRGIAARDYPPELIEVWAPLPITQERIERVVANLDNETRFVADSDGNVIGIGCLVIDNSELRACYVAPDFSRNGIGRALVGAIENAALCAGLEHLWAHSSLTAAEFYRSLGYTIVGQDVHWLRKNISMPCIRIEKKLQGEAGRNRS